MKTGLGNLNTIDIHFLVVIWMGFTYVTAVFLMFFVAPGNLQYFYSVVDANNKSGKTDIIFVLFLLLWVYAKAAQTYMMCTEAFSIMPTLLSAAFWMDYFRRYTLKNNSIFFKCICTLNPVLGEPHWMSWEQLTKMISQDMVPLKSKESLVTTPAGDCGFQIAKNLPLINIFMYKAYV